MHWNAAGLITLCILQLGFATPKDGHAQPAPQSATVAADLNRRVSHFYRDGRVEDVPGLILQWRAAAGPMPPLLGFIIGLSVKYPDQINRMFPPSLDNGAQRLAVVGVRVGISTERAKMLAHHYRWPEKDTVDIGQGTTVDKLTINIPADQDMFWGAGFATGDSRYPQRILDHYVLIANRRDIDIKQVMALIRGIPGYSPGILKTVKEKEGDQKVRDLVLAASALWSLESNAAQHDFVRKVVDMYVTANPNTPASDGLRQVAEAAKAERGKRAAPQRL